MKISVLITLIHDSIWQFAWYGKLPKNCWLFAPLSFRKQKCSSNQASSVPRTKPLASGLLLGVCLIEQGKNFVLFILRFNTMIKSLLYRKNWWICFYGPFINWVRFGSLLGTPLLASWNIFTFISSLFYDVSQISRMRGKKVFLDILIFSFQNLCIPSHRIDWHFMGRIPKINEQVS